MIFLILPSMLQTSLENLCNSPKLSSVPWGNIVHLLPVRGPHSPPHIEESNLMFLNHYQNKVIPRCNFRHRWNQVVNNYKNTVISTSDVIRSHHEMYPFAYIVSIV